VAVRDSAAELELAARSARKKAVDVETVFDDEFPGQAAGDRPGSFEVFGVPYEPFKADRIKPLDPAEKPEARLRRIQPVVPIEEAKEGLVILCLDPEKVKSSRMFRMFSRRASSCIALRLSRNSRHAQGVLRAEAPTRAIWRYALGLEQDEVAVEGQRRRCVAAADNELVKLVNKVIIDGLQQGRRISTSSLPARPKPRSG